MNTYIVQAINSLQILQFTYEGKLRVVEPYCYGLSLKNKEVLRAYQIAGSSTSGEPEGWKMFSVAKISGLSASGARFTTLRSDYNPRDKSMSSIFANVKLH